MRLIDAEALYKKSYWHGDCPDVGNPYAEGVEAVDVGDIDDAPTIEAEPVKHGRWGYSTKIAFSEECSVCGGTVGWGDGYLHKYNYCPHCGAKMDLEESNGE